MIDSQLKCVSARTGMKWKGEGPSSFHQDSLTSRVALQQIPLDQNIKIDNSLEIVEAQLLCFLKIPSINLLISITELKPDCGYPLCPPLPFLIFDGFTSFFCELYFLFVWILRRFKITLASAI